MGKTLGIFALVLGIGAAAPALAMGGGGGYGGGGGFSGGGSMKFDDYTMAMRFIHREKYAEAIPYLERALSDRPHNADTMNYLGYTNRMVGNDPLSLAWYQKALTEDPDHKGAHEYLGELYLNMKDLASAQGQLAELVRLCPDSCDERDTLTKAIAAYQAANPAPAAAATTTSAPAAAAAAPSQATAPATQQ